MFHSSSHYTLAKTNSKHLYYAVQLNLIDSEDQFHKYIAKGPVEAAQ